MRILLLTGIPGTGKTKIGNHLKDHYGFIHIDIEAQHTWPEEYKKYDKDHLGELMKALKAKNEDVVITWGFIPEFDDKYIFELQKHGAIMFWFDGDRAIAKGHWKNRDNPLDDWLFDYQVKRIDNDNIQGKFAPIPFNTFQESGKHKDKDEIIEKLFEYLN